MPALITFLISIPVRNISRGWGRIYFGIPIWEDTVHHDGEVMAGFIGTATENWWAGKRRWTAGRTWRKTGTVDRLWPSQLTRQQTTSSASSPPKEASLPTALPTGNQPRQTSLWEIALTAVEFPAHRSLWGKLTVTGNIDSPLLPHQAL